MKIRLRIDYDSGEATAFIDVDLEMFTEEMAKDTLDFFGWEYGEDPRYESVKRHGIEAIFESTKSNLNTEGIIECFSINSVKEGFFPLDGKYGLTLINVDGYDLDESLFEIKEVAIA